MRNGGSRASRMNWRRMLFSTQASVATKTKPANSTKATDPASLCHPKSSQAMPPTTVSRWAHRATAIRRRKFR
ncbi:hypothetical protein D3C72_2198520 [compost metagenome]